MAYNAPIRLRASVVTAVGRLNIVDSPLMVGQQDSRQALFRQKGFIDGRDCCQTGQLSQDVADGALTLMWAVLTYFCSR